MRGFLVWVGPSRHTFIYIPFSHLTRCNTVGTVARSQGDLYIVHIHPPDSLMPPDNDLSISGAHNLDRDHPQGHRLGGERFHSQRTQRTYQHPQIRSLIAKHCEQLSSGLVDIFRTEVEREVKQRVSEVIVSEATACCEHLRSKDEALSAAETRCKELQEQLELTDQTCRQLQERVVQLEATEAELRTALNEALEVVRSFHPLRPRFHSSVSCSSSRPGLPRPH